MKDYRKITEGGYDAWSATLKSDLDWAKMGFKDNDVIDEYLQKTYKNFNFACKDIKNSGNSLKKVQ